LPCLLEFLLLLDHPPAGEPQRNLAIDELAARGLHHKRLSVA
jgi:hypothetical protein